MQISQVVNFKRQILMAPICEAHCLLELIFVVRLSKARTGPCKFSPGRLIASSTEERSDVINEIRWRDAGWSQFQGSSAVKLIAWR